MHKVKRLVSRLSIGIAFAMAMGIGFSASATYKTVEDEGSPLPQQDTINFTGDGITCTDDSGGKTLCDVDGNVTDEVYHAADYASGSSTGGLQEAIDAACATVVGNSGRRCGTVVLPQGTVRLTEKVVVGSNTDVADRAFGLRVVGQGRGLASGGPEHFGGTTLVYSGSASLNDAMIEIQGGQDNYFTGFSMLADDELDGSNVADHCIKFSPKVGSPEFAATLRNVFDQINCSHAAVSGVFLSSRSGYENQQADHNTFRDMRIAETPKCFHIDNTNTQETIISGLDCLQYSTYGVHVERGRGRLQNSQFSGITSPLSTIHIDVNANQFTAQNVQIEIDSGDFITSSGTSPITADFQGFSIFTDASSGNQSCIDWVRPGTLIYSNNKCSQAGSGTTSVDIAPPAGTTLDLVYRANRAHDQETIYWDRIVDPSRTRTYQFYLDGEPVAGNCLRTEFSQPSLGCSAVNGNISDNAILVKDKVYVQNVRCTHAIATGLDVGDSIDFKARFRQAGSAVTDTSSVVAYTNVNNATIQEGALNEPSPFVGPHFMSLVMDAISDGGTLLSDIDMMCHVEVLEP